jgi:hypothetical protein
MTPYRDESSGLGARLADARERWQRVSLLTFDIQDGIGIRGARIGGGVGALLGLFVLLVSAGWMVDHATIWVPIGAFVLAKIAGKVLGRRMAERRAGELLAGAGAPADPMRAIAYFEEQTPKSVIARAAEQMETTSVVLHLLSGWWFALQVLFVGLFLGDGGKAELAFSAYVGGLLLLHATAVAGTLAWVARGRDARRQAVLIAALAFAGTVACVVASEFGLLPLAIQLALLGIRAYLLQGAVLRERIRLC